MLAEVLSFVFSVLRSQHSREEISVAPSDCCEVLY